MSIWKPVFVKGELTNETMGSPEFGDVVSHYKLYTQSKHKRKIQFYQETNPFISVQMQVSDCCIAHIL